MALSQIRDKDRHLLAVFAYIRFEFRHPGKIDDIWSWSDSEIEVYKKSIERRNALASIKAIKHAFDNNSEMKKQGFRLDSAPRVRSYQQQINE